MDANGTRFHLLLGLDDWGRCEIVPTQQKLSAAFEAAKNGQEAVVSWSARQELTLGRRITVFPTAPANRPPSPSQRRGAAIDELGEIFWISDDEHAILAARPGESPAVYWTSQPPTIPCKPKELGAFRTPDDAAAPPPLLTLRGLASLPGGYLVAGAVELRGLLVFDVRTGGTPQQLLWPADVPFEPFDLAATSSGGVAVLDAAQRRVWQLDRAFHVVAPWLEGSADAAPSFHSVDDGKPACSTVPVTLEHSFAAHPDAIGIAALANGSLLVLVTSPAAAFSTIHRYRDGVERDSFSTEAANILIDSDQRGTFSLLAHDFAAVVRGGEQLLYVIGADGDQALVFLLTFEDDAMKVEPRPELVTLRLFGGKGLVAGGGTVYYDFGDRWLPLVSQNRGRFQRQATVRVPKLDGKQTDCVWHRLFLDACIPPECDVLVATRASNDEDLLPFAPLVQEPPLLRRNEPPHGCGTSTWELLFQHARGRFLQIELTLTGNGRATPSIRALQAYYPRFSYLDHYLPAAYRENAESASFLDRFLSLFEGFFTTIEDRIAAAHLLIDVRSAPPDALEWLAGWFAIAFDDSWTEDRRRLFLRHAVEFFEWRGTVRGLLAALGLALEECPDESLFDFSAPLPRTAVRIQEAFRGRPATAVAEVSAEALNPPEESDSTWIAHLERTYGSAAALNEKYGTDFQSLADVAARRASPANVARIAPELRFFAQSVAPFNQTAHHFSVFFPLPPGSTDAPRRTELASRVIRLEKPAHTTFEVDFYWTWFRLGEARLGEGTVVDLGSRSPSLIAPYAVGATRIGAAYLAPDAAALGPGRMILGRSCGAQPSTSGEMR